MDVRLPAMRLRIHFPPVCCCRLEPRLACRPALAPPQVCCSTTTLCRISSSGTSVWNSSWLVVWTMNLKLLWQPRREAAYQRASQRFESRIFRRTRRPDAGSVSAGTRSQSICRLSQYWHVWPRQRCSARSCWPLSRSLPPTAPCRTVSLTYSYQDIGSASYNAMQASLTFNRTRNLNGSVAYTWSKLLGNVQRSHQWLPKFDRQSGDSGLLPHQAI